jgi:hypothetical protein
MRIFISVITLVCAVLFSGCATGQNRLVLDVVGPDQSLPQIAQASATNGCLIVYSAYRRNADFNSRDPYHPEYSDYQIFSNPEGFSRRIHNNSGNSMQSVLPVRLAAGQYKVKARANTYGYVIVPVVILPNQTTILHLEGDGNWPDPSLFNQTNAVRLPDGLVVGWRANVASTP